MKTEMLGDRLERLILALPAVPLPSGRPVAIPDAAPVETDARNTGTRAIQPFLVPESPAACVCKSGMREIEILDGPSGLVVGWVSFSFAKEDQFKPEPFATGRGHITRVIPPFRAKVLMLEVISRKLVSITGESFAILEAAAQQWENTERKCQYPQEPA